MARVLFAKAASAKVDNNKAEGSLKGAAVGYASLDAAIAAVRSAVASSLTVGGFSPRRASIDVQQVAHKHYVWTCDYKDEEDKDSESQPEVLSWRFRFSTGSATQKIIRSLKTVARAGIHTSPPPPSMNRIIGWDGKKIHGCEIEVATGDFDIECYFAATTVATLWYQGLKRKANHKNNAAWLGFPKGELRFKGPKGDQQLPLVGSARSKPVAVTLSFHHELNTSIVLRKQMPPFEDDNAFQWFTDNWPTEASTTSFTKEGQDYIHYTYRTVDIGGIPTPVIDGAYVEQVYPELDFATTFGFGA